MLSQVTCRQRPWGVSNCLFARTAYICHWQILWEMQTGDVCALLSLSCTGCSDIHEAPNQTHDLGNTPEELSLELAWILTGSIWKVTHADDVWWTDSFDQLQRSMEHRNTPVCAVAAVGLLILGAAIDQPEQVLCVSGMLAWSKTCFKEHSWQCKNRNSLSVSSFDCFGVYVCWKWEAMYSDSVHQCRWHGALFEMNLSKGYTF